jgi:hypothetical protein
MIDKEEEPTEAVETEVNEKAMPDENMHLFVYGNLLIKDVESGQTLVNKSF